MREIKKEKKEGMHFPGETPDAKFTHLKSKLSIQPFLSGTTLSMDRTNNFANIIFVSVKICFFVVLTRLCSFGLKNYIRCNISNKKHNMHKLISWNIIMYNFFFTLKRYITRYHKHISCHILCGWKKFLQPYIARIITIIIYRTINIKI